MTDFSKIPTTPHFAIVTQDSVHIPGDERSRTHPGHGYPAETRYFSVYEAFTDRELWESRIRNLTRSQERFHAMEVKPAKVETKISVKVS